MADNNLGVDYEAVLADLRVKRDQLNAAIAGIELMMGISPSSSAAPQGKGSAEKLPEHIESDTFFGMSVPDAARKFLAMRKRPQTTQQIASALEEGGVLHSSKDFPNTVGTVLTRIDKSGGDIVKVDRAKFGLASWYPNAKRRKAGKPTENGGVLESVEPDDAAEDAKSEGDEGFDPFA